MKRHTPVYIRFYSWQCMSEEKPSHEVEGFVHRAPRQDCAEAQIWEVYQQISQPRLCKKSFRWMLPLHRTLRLCRDLFWIINWVVQALDADWLTAVYHRYNKACMWYMANACIQALCVASYIRKTVNRCILAIYHAPP